jgi:hypothetical protein
MGQWEGFYSTFDRGAILFLDTREITSSLRILGIKKGETFT